MIEIQTHNVRAVSYSIWWRDYELPRWCSVKESACQAGNMDSIPALGRAPGEVNSNPVQYSCLENSMVGYSPWSHKESDMTE